MTNGLLSMFGQEQSPFANWLDPRRNAITQFGAGLVGAGSTRDALRGASQGLAQGAQMDSVYALQKQEEQKAQDQLNSTIQYLQQAHPDLAAAVSNGADIQSVWGEAMRRDGQGAQGPDYRTVGDTLLEIGADGVRPVYTAPQAPAVPETFNTLGLDDQIRLESAAAKDYRGYDEVETYNKIRDSYERIRQSASQDSPSGDMGLIFNFMKMLDPGSTVREGEFATAQQTTGVPGYIVNLYNQAINGTRLNPQQRRQFVELAQGLYNETAQNLTVLNEQVSPRYSSYGMDPSRFTITPETYDPIDTSSWTDVPDMPGVQIRLRQ